MKTVCFETSFLRRSGFRCRVEKAVRNVPGTYSAQRVEQKTLHENDQVYCYQVVVQGQIQMAHFFRASLNRKNND